jgi:hypothetical protein
VAAKTDADQATATRQVPGPPDGRADRDLVAVEEDVLGNDADAVARISESLVALGRGERGVDLATVRADLARRRHGGA